MNRFLRPRWRFHDSRTLNNGRDCGREKIDSKVPENETAYMIAPCGNGASSTDVGGGLDGRVPSGLRVVPTSHSLD